MAKSNRISVSGDSNPLLNNPFAGLGGKSGSIPADPAGRPAGGKMSTREFVVPAPESPPARSRGRVDIKREKAGRGGKTVTVISGFTGVAGDERSALAKRLQKTCGVGGTIKEGRIELQGDQMETAVAFLAAAGFRPVRCGG